MFSQADLRAARIMAWDEAEADASVEAELLDGIRDRASLEYPLGGPVYKLRCFALLELATSFYGEENREQLLLQWREFEHGPCVSDWARETMWE